MFTIVHCDKSRHKPSELFHEVRPFGTDIVDGNVRCPLCVRAVLSHIAVGAIPLSEVPSISRAFHVPIYRTGQYPGGQAR